MSTQERAEGEVRDASEGPAAVEISRYPEAVQAWRSDDFRADLGGASDAYLRAGTVFRLDGAEHRDRRRTMGLLLRQRGHQRFRDTALYPYADAALERVLADRDAEGIAHVEIYTWALRVNQQLAAAIVGFDDAVTPQGAGVLGGLLDLSLRGFQSGFHAIFEPFDPEGPAEKAGIEARKEIVERFYRPSLARRQQLVRDVEAGRLDEAELPSDLLTLIARRLEPAWEDEGVAQREALFLLQAGVHTTSSSLVWTLRELFEWFEQHPEDRALRGDEQFLMRAAHEALRLHPVVAGFPRRADADTELCEHSRLRKGDIAVIRSGPASVDTDVFGSDAAEFNPHRELGPGVRRHGLAFGAGAHMCYGMPIVMGTDGVDGSLVYLTKILVRADVQPDPTRTYPPLSESRGRFVADYAVGHHGEYHVVIPPAGR
jgi:cytochrome P450